jgi:hypothetical protein
MDIRWQGEIHINAPYDLVYGYLSDFPRHAEWTQTVERMELTRPGDESGVGARYRTFERQGMQANRAPGQPITAGQPLVTLCEVRELCPCYRIAWHAHTEQKPTISAELSIDLNTHEQGGTRLVQRIVLSTTKTYDMLDKLRNRTDPVVWKAQMRAQWEAGLRNIKEIMETEVLRRELQSESALEPMELQTRERSV